MMKISLEKLPPKGLMLLYCKDGAVFAPYEVKDGQLISNAKLPPMLHVTAIIAWQNIWSPTKMYTVCYRPAK